MNIPVSILFDAAYVEPALVTAYEAITRFPALSKLYLIFQRGGDKDDAACIRLIQEFCNRFSASVPIAPVGLDNSLARFDNFHFTNSIIYKALIPSIIGDETYIMNLDAGILLGQRFGRFWDEVGARLKEGGDWVIAAHCHDPAALIPSALAELPRNPLYPAGNLLLFNCAAYHKRNWYARYVANYARYIDHLKYAEQELICLTAEPGEILSLPGTEDRVTPFLGDGILTGKDKPISYAQLEESLFFKFVGSFKPWKYWVLDPNKALYIRRRAELESVFRLAGNDLIEWHRQQTARPEWPLAFLKAYDNYLQQQQ